MTQTNTYTVTDRAGLKVAGRRVSRGEHLDLTAEEAEFDLREGAIVPKGEKLPGATKKDDAADQARAEAAAFKAGGPTPPAVAAAPIADTTKSAKAPADSSSNGA